MPVEAAAPPQHLMPSAGDLCLVHAHVEREKTGSPA